MKRTKKNEKPPFSSWEEIVEAHKPAEESPEVIEKRKQRLQQGWDEICAFMKRLGDEERKARKRIWKIKVRGLC